MMKRQNKTMSNMLTCFVIVMIFHNGASARSATSSTILFASRDNHQQYATARKQPWRLHSAIDMRGGAGQPTTKLESNIVSKKRRRKKSSSSSTSQRTKTNAPVKDAPDSSVNQDSTTTMNNNRHEINKTLLQQDPAQFLGDTIRQRGDELLLQKVSRSVNSLKWGLGASDYDESLRQQTTTSIVDDDNDNDAASLVSPTAVIAQYFVTSHGGAHAFQTLCSLLATLAGLGAVWTSLTLGKLSVTAAASVSANDSTSAAAAAAAAYSTRLYTSLSLVRRACQWAMVQHFAGMLAAAVLAAQAVPVVGLRQARGYVHGLVKDPLAQYVFVSASILAWLPSRQSNNAAGAAAANLEWWMTQSWTRFVPIILVGPILIREVVSIGLVISDVLVLSTLGSSQHDTKRRTIQTILTLARYVTDACMSLLVTPSVWKNANVAQRQEILAKLTSRVSLVLELAIGALMAVDAVWTIFGCLVFASSQQRPALTHVAKRILCAHLFWVFLSTRRRKIHRLVTSMRGGAAQLPFYVLNVLLHPRECMGLDDAKDERLAPPLEIVEENKLPRRKWKSVFEALLAVDEGS